MLKQPRQSTSQAGFTLVELAIVMIIIGLLIAGVLKGQELINNARTTSTVAQIKSIDAAVSTFRDQYGALPGDLANPANRIPNCANSPSCTAAAAANANGQLDAANSFTAAPGVEAAAFFPELSNANLITGINNTSATLAFGSTFPATKIDGSGYVPGTVTTVVAGNFPGSVGILGTSSGLYLAVVNTAAAPAQANTGLQPKQANSIDTKLDDGVPGSGSVIGIGTVGTGATDCASTGTSAGVYVSSNASGACGLYVRIQG